MKAYTRFGPLVAREVGEEQLDFDEVSRPEDNDDDDDDDDDDDIRKTGRVLGNSEDHYKD